MLQIRLTANAGVLIETENARIFLDALHCEGDHPFSKVPSDLLERMNHEDNRFRDVDYIVFSHGHPDHYSPGVVLEYLRHNQVRRLLLPQEDPERESDLSAFMCRKNIPMWRLGMQEGQRHTYALSKSIHVTAVGMRHMAGGLPGRLCDCILLTLPHKHLLFLSDCAVQNGGTFDFLYDLPISAMFINPYFFHTPMGRSLIHTKIQPHLTILYHIPFSGEDYAGMRGLVRQDMRKYGTDFPNLQAFMEPEQVISL
ncbi:MAG: MBL fold metallo-hydrolase [Clostridiales bacterium]|nr:MBL fold metallo-hydrolase [Clostridiales bacterium]